ncbi:ABC transporter ATP-binding protein [Candidatus Bipolaricaulota sp. J31]
MKDEAIVELEGVWKVYRMGRRRRIEVEALRGVDLRVERGEFLAVMGPSGSGKSTLLHLMGCLDRPTKGRVLFEGADVSGLRPAALARIRNERIGFVFQSFNLSPTLTALGNVELPMIFAGVPRGERLRRARELLARVGLRERERHLPLELSGGEQQRVAIAWALANSPDLLLADEPTGNLDTETGREVLSLISGAHRGRVTVVVVTHDPEVAAAAVRMLRIRDGRIAGGVDG